MQILVDTGVLLRAFDSSSSHQRPILRALRVLWDKGDELLTSHQDIAEFWNVATRPSSARGGFGLKASEVEKQIAVIERLGGIIAFDHACYAEWRQILVAQKIIGVSVHDARLVAMMNCFQIANILTLNAADFQRYPDIVVWTPYDVKAGLSIT